MCAPDTDKFLQLSKVMRTLDGKLIKYWIKQRKGIEPFLVPKEKKIIQDYSMLTYEDLGWWLVPTWEEKEICFKSASAEFKYCNSGILIFFSNLSIFYPYNTQEIYVINKEAISDSLKEMRQNYRKGVANG